MLNTANTKYPYFELLEIVPELEFGHRNYKPLSPVKTGNFVPSFSLVGAYERWQQFYNGAETHGPVLLRSLLNKPLVISFYSHHWKNAGLEQLKQLQAIQSEVKAHGGNLLVINADKNNSLQKLAWENSLSLNFYHDTHNEIAKRFRIYSEANPTWNTFSGIDANVPLIATYVIDPARQVVFSHIDHELSGRLPVKELLAATYHAALELTGQKSA
jgi:peroxiredoxin